MIRLLPILLLAGCGANANKVDRPGDRYPEIFNYPRLGVTVVFVNEKDIPAVCGENAEACAVKGMIFVPYENPEYLIEEFCHVDRDKFAFDWLKDDCHDGKMDLEIN